jgi:hypothetical protein
MIARQTSVRWFASTVAAKQPKRLSYVRNLPWYAQSDRIPREWKVFGFASLLPLWAGGLAVHVIPTIEPENLDTDRDTARQVMAWTLHYSAILVGCQSALHWGMQGINMGLPTHTVEFTPLYRFMRFGLPVVPLTVAVLASRLSIENPREATIVLMCVQAASTGFDLFAYAFATCPVWFTKYHWNLSMGILGGFVVLLLSERMKLKGELQMIQEKLDR